MQGEVREVTLRRMARVDLADHVRMFELFTRVKMVAASIGEDTVRMEDGSESSMLECVDDCIRLWTDMSHADADHSKAMAANIVELQNDCNECIRLLCETLSRVVQLKREKDTKIKHLESSLVLAEDEPVRKIINAKRQTLLERKRALEEQALDADTHPTETVGVLPPTGRIYELLRTCEYTCGHLKQALSKDVLAVPAMSSSGDDFAFQSTVRIYYNLVVQCSSAFCMNVTSCS